MATKWTFTSFISLFYSALGNRQRTIKPQVISLYDIFWSNSEEGEEKLILSGLFLKVNQIIDRKKDERENKRTKCHWRRLTVNEKQSLCCLIILSLHTFSQTERYWYCPLNCSLKNPIVSRKNKHFEVLCAYWCLKLNFPLWYSSSELKNKQFWFIFL